MAETNDDAWKIEEDLGDEGAGPAALPPPPQSVSSSGEGDASPSPVAIPLRCPVCDRAGEGPAGAFARCTSCGTLYRRERASLGHVAKARDVRFRRAFSLPSHEEQRQAKGFADDAMRGFFRIRMGKPAALNAFGESVLEVNCGPGLRLRAFEGYGWAVAGTETSTTAYEHARRQGLDVRHGWPDDASFGRTKFDLVLFCGSFGEIPAPLPTMARLRDLMTADGITCILREPLAIQGAVAPPDESRLALYTPDSLRQVVCAGRFSFDSEQIEGDVGTFWFTAKQRR